MFDLETFIAECQMAVNGPTPEIAVREVVERAVAHPAALERVLGTPSWGGLTTLHRAPDFTVLNVVWAPGMAVFPHDHRMWAVIGIYGGREDNTFYRRSSPGLAVAAVTNPLRQFTGAIHVYGGDFFAAPRSEFDPETLEERPYDVERTKRVFADANERWRAECAAADQASR
jgi:predicted metal-dependent enzyme (double-stranded beta helix superfamily)